jgi:SAM-dependent methyltransferase
VGCGRGEWSRTRAERGEFVVAIDVNAERLGQALAQARGPIASRMSFVRADAARLPFRDRCFDAATCFEVLEHLADPDHALAEIRRVLRTGSEFELSVPTWWSERLFAAIWPDWLEVCTHRRVFGRAELIWLCDQQRFRVEAVSGSNFYWTYFWFFHCLARTRHDGTGQSTEHQSLTKVLRAAWAFCGTLPFWPFVVRWGNRLFPKSVYLRCRAVERTPG